MSAKKLLLLILVACIVALYLLDPVQYALMPKCVFKLTTGWSCPGCGIQRAAHAALHGDFLQAIHYNWFLVFSLPYAIALVIAQWFVSEERKTKMYKILGHRYMIYTYVLLFCVWGIVRNILDI